MKWFDNLKQLFKGKELNAEEYAHWVSIGRPKLMFYANSDRRVEHKNRGSVPWDEPYERRNTPHTY
tara:strand:- start:428 stop:625 length:198 start_codon:yes stop_codon:yes gene_type:complete